jgi:hydrogenase maturation protease
MKKMQGQNAIREFGNATPVPSYSTAMREEYTGRHSRKRSVLSEREASGFVGTHRTGVRCNSLVLGMGSEFLGDDGVGVHAVRALANEGLPAGTELVELANHLVDALVALQKADRIILLDVLRAKGKPGSVYRVSLQPVQISEKIPFSHSPDLFRALYLGGCFGFLDVIVIGMEPSAIDWSATLSTEARNALPLMVQAVKAELNRPAMKSSAADTTFFAVNPEPKPFSEGLRRSA